MRLFEGTQFDRPPRCETCGELEKECACSPAPPPRIAPDKQHANIQVEKRRNGKLVTTIRGLTPEGNDLPHLLTQLKSACGAGGTLKTDVIEIQGDQRERVGNVLEEIGYRVSVC